MKLSSAFPGTPNARTSAIVVAVVLFHGGGLWALQSGLLHRSVAEVVVPAEVLIDMSPADTEPAPPKPQPQTAPPAAARTLSPQLTPQPAAAPAPQAVATPLAVPLPPTEPDNAALSPAPVAAATSTANGSGSNASPPVGSSTAAATPRAPALELPNSDAQYLNNPKPPYPPLSKRMGEQGKVVIRTFIGVDGVAQQAHIKQSSGFDRLDQAALATALKWRYAPGKRAGVAEAMWFDVPFNWQLQ